MAVNRRIYVCVLNVTLPRQEGRKPTPEDYFTLMRRALRLRRPIALHGDRHGLLQFVPREPDWNLVHGIVGTFVRIDINDDWINMVSGDKASRDDLSQISIPPGLQPHYRRYNYLFDLATHKLAIETRSEPEVGKSPSALSPMLAESLFQDLFQQPELLDEFGMVNVTVMPHREAVEELIAWRKAEKITIVIKPPNPDDDDLEEKLERRLATMNAAQYDQTLKAAKDERLQPDEEAEAAMRVASRNGHVEVEGEEGGTKVTKSTRDKPLIESGSYNKAVESHTEAFTQTARDAIEKATPRARRRRSRG